MNARTLRLSLFVSLALPLASIGAGAAAEAPALSKAPTAAAAAAPLVPPTPFTPDVYQARRAKLAKMLGTGVAVLYARGEEDAEGYRPDGDFYYLTGLKEPGAVLVLAPAERTYREVLYLKPRNPEDERWTGDRADINDSLRKATGFDFIQRTDGVGGGVMGRLQNSPTFRLINDPGSVDSPVGPEMELYGKLSARLPGVTLKNDTELIAAMRSIKEPRELEMMERAIAATVSAHRAAARAIHPSVEENWVAGLIDLEFKRGGSVRPAFSSIVGSGKESTVLHYPEHGRTIAPGSLVVVDIGADYGHYAADVTRTYPADGHFTPEQRKVYEVVLRAQQTCADLVRPGVYFQDLQRKAEEIIRAAGYRDYFIHGLGHFVGLDVHDAGVYRKPLQAGMVITIEPGIYIPEKSLGVRIEDEFLVTANGVRHLTSALPRDPDAVERMMRGE